MSRLLTIILSLLLCISCYSKQPDIDTKDVHKKVEEILKAHVSHREVDEAIIERALSNFVDDLDPHKTYFLAEEVENFVNPDKKLVRDALNDYSKANFKVFGQIYAQYIKAIDRREQLEEEISKKDATQDVDSKKLKDLNWAKNSEELATRLLEIRFLQLKSAEKMDDDTKVNILKHIEKRRRNYEAEFTNKEEREKHICALVLKSIASSLDSHTNYFTPNEANQFMIQVQQRLFGIGAQLRDTLNGFTIMRIIEGGPAEKCGKLKNNDRIIAVNHEPIVGLDITEGVEKIRGEEGTEVELTICRDHADGKTETFDLKLTRNEIVIEETRLKSEAIPFADGALAYLKLYSFYQDENTSSTQDILKALEEIEKEHKIKGVLLDLRGNTGGLLNKAVGVAGLFIHQGIVVSVKDNEDNVQHLRETSADCAFDGPLVILTDKASASASEIVAQSLQDYGRAIVVGDEHTFGKGSFQTLTLTTKSSGKVDPKGEYKVTRGRYYTVSGKSPQLVGVKADIKIPGIFSSAEIGEKFGKFPLETDKIDPNFKDNMEDIPLIHRFQAARLYNMKPQQKLTSFSKHLEKLNKNANTRIEKNENYQTFLSELEKENYDHESIDFFRKADFQKQEAENILKDLVFLCVTEEKKAAS